MPKPTLPALRRDPLLDAVRGVAITLVVLFHLAGDLPPLPYRLTRAIEYVANIGWTGVDLFFVLSGFLIGGILMSKRGSANYFRSFYGRRFVRIIPLYALTLAVYLALYFGIDWRSAGLTKLFDGAGLPQWSYFVFAQNILIAASGHWEGPRWLGITWSLAVEEQFYLVLPALVLFVPVRRLAYVCLAFIVGAPLLRVGMLAIAPGNTVAPYVLMPCRADGLFMGVLAAWIVRDDQARALLLKWRVALSIVFWLGFVAFVASFNKIRDAYKYSVQSIGYTIIAGFFCLGLLLLVTAKPGPSWLHLVRRPLCWLGIGAYSIYLFHRPVQGLLAGAGHGHTGFGLLTTVAVLVGVALAAWLLVERPAIAWGRRTFP